MTPDLIAALTTLLTGLIAAAGVFVYRAHKARALQTTAKAEAHVTHAEADKAETEARLSLDTATRQWAATLIERWDRENAELREELRQTREAYHSEIEKLREQYERDKIDLEQRYRLRIEQMQAEIDALRAENRNLLELIRRKSTGHL